MKPRGMLSVALGACAAVVALALVFGHTTDRSRVCPTIGYAYVGDVELSFNHEPASVAACFGEGCTRATVAKNPDGRWLVPQSLPYLVAPVSVTSINVEAASSSGVRHTRGPADRN